MGTDCDKVDNWNGRRHDCLRGAVDDVYDDRSGSRYGCDAG